MTLSKAGDVGEDRGQQGPSNHSKKPCPHFILNQREEPLKNAKPARMHWRGSKTGSRGASREVTKSASGGELELGQGSGEDVDRIRNHSGGRLYRTWSSRGCGS